MCCLVKMFLTTDVGTIRFDRIGMEELGFDELCNLFQCAVLVCRDEGGKAMEVWGAGTLILHRTTNAIDGTKNPTNRQGIMSEFVLTWASSPIIGIAPWAIRTHSNAKQCCKHKSHLYIESIHCAEWISGCDPTPILEGREFHDDAIFLHEQARSVITDDVSL